jgi:capsule polysaccharide export protein KpsE/RkpR
MNRTTQVFFGVALSLVLWAAPAVIADEQPRDTTRVSNDQQEYVHRIETQLGKWQSRLGQIEKNDAGQSSDRHATGESRQDAIKEVRASIAEIKTDLNQIKSGGEPSLRALKSKIDAKVDYVNSNLDQFAD